MHPTYLNPKLKAMWHGGDYNPDQWPPEIWREDVRLMQASACQVATVGIFAWARMEPQEGRYDFGWMDEVIELLEAGDRWFILSTPSAAPPAWLSHKYPETLRTGPDRVRRMHGNRVNFNLGSPIYREKTREIARVLAERYGNHPRLLAWHMSNEYGGADYGSESLAAFREWLRQKFHNDLDALNHAYWNAFWGHTYSDWSQIEPPGDPYGETASQALTVDWKRFVTDQTVDFMNNEAAPLRAMSPHVPITTNMMGTYEGLDYRKFAPHLDFISWDCYPAFETPLGDPRTWLAVSFKHDLMRSLKPDRPWLLMESTPSSANWYPYMQLKRPGMHRFEAYHAVAHGADGVQYFQWRQSRGGMEQYHGAVVAHGGAEDTRLFKEVQEVGRELGAMADVAGTVISSDVALIFDWESRWAIDAACGPVRKDKNYERTCIEHYRALRRAGVTVDLLGQDDSLIGYKLVVAPVAYSLRPRFVEDVERFVGEGGVFVTTYLTGWVDENSLVFEGGFLTPLAKVLGVRSEEIDVLYPEQLNWIEFEANDLGLKGRFEATDFCELVHADGAKVLATYTDEFYAGRPALTRHEYRHGAALYLAARCEPALHDGLYKALVEQAGVRRAIEADLPEGVLASVRTDGEKQFLFLLNASTETQNVQATAGQAVELAPFEAWTGRLTGSLSGAGQAL